MQKVSYILYIEPSRNINDDSIYYFRRCCMNLEVNNFIELNAWYAIDKYGRIIEFLTSGFGNIPKFVYAYESNNKMLENYFETKSINHYLKVTGKDYFCFDACIGEGDTTNYLKLTTPKKPLLISDLPPKISEILSNNILNIDVETNDIIAVEHTYSTRMSFEDLVSTITKGQFRLNFKNRYFSIDFKTKLKLKKVNNIFKKSSAAFMEIKSAIEVVDQIENIKKYYEITTSQGEFVLYFVYKRDIVIYDESDLYSVQISKKDKAIFDFNDKSGVWIKA